MAFQPINFLNAPRRPSLVSQIPKLFTQGFQMAQLPEQARQQAEQNKLKQALLQAQINRQNQMTGQSAAQANRLALENERLIQFRNMLRSSMGGRAPEDEGQQEGQENSPAPMSYGHSPSTVSQVAQDSTDVEPGSTLSAAPPVHKNSRQVLDAGDPRLYQLDHLFMQNPDYRDQFEKMGYKMHRAIKNNPETGQAFEEITYPSGKVEVQAFEVGKQPEQIARGKEMAKTDAGVYKNALEATQTSQSALDNLDYIQDIIQNNKNFDNVTGPVKNVLATWIGSKEDKELIGNIQSSVGNIVLDAAKSIKGAFTGRDIGLINSIKPNVNDFPDVFRGKLNSMRIIGNLVNNRNKLIANYIRNGVNPNEAMEKARAETDLQKIKEQIMKPIREAEKSSMLKKSLSSNNQVIGAEGVTLNGKQYFKQNGQWYER